MKTKKSVIAVLTVTLLVTAVLIVGCMNPMDGISYQGGNSADSYKAPAGKGVVRFNLSDNNARTILPDLTTTPLSGMYFDVRFTPASGPVTYFPGYAATAPATKATLAQLDNIAISLDAGTYTAMITAYDNAAGATPIAGWTSTTGAISITASQANTPVTVNLTGFVNGTDDGIFSYSITIPDVTYTTTLNITGYGNAYPGSSVILDADDINAASIPLPSGYYIVKVTSSETYYQTQEYTEALHIYPIMTSTMTPLNTPAALVKNIFQVDFDLASELVSNGTAFGIRNIGYANVIGTVANPAPTNPSTAFGGWFKEVGLTTPWTTFATDRVFTDQTMYAKFVPAGTPGTSTFIITFTFADLASPATPSSASISRATFNGGSTVTLTLAPPPGPGNTWDSVTWTIGGTDFSSHVNGSGQLVINNSADFYSILAANFFVVSIVADKGGVPYSPPPVTITVTN
jgi:hypothetical protein